MFAGDSEHAEKAIYSIKGLLFRSQSDVRRLQAPSLTSDAFMQSEP
jgi:hypothetical protein